MLDRDMIDAEIRKVLGRIYDPCSVASGRPVSLLDMGLVRGWELEGGVLSITFCVTFAGCTMAPHFMEAAARDLSLLDNVKTVETMIDADFIWTPELMTAGRPPMTGQPQAWRNRVSL